jgi:choline dehydrogenase-like flavoprotein
MIAQTYRDSDIVDFVIVGSGAAGGVIARELAQAGLTVVVLEQGPRFALRNFRHDELKDWYLGGITNDVVKNPQTFRDDGAKKAELQKFKPALWYGRGVGGSSLHYTANFWRLHDTDFIDPTLLGAIPGPASPTGRSRMPISNRITRKSSGSSACRASRREPSIRRGRSLSDPPLPVKSSGVLFERGAHNLGSIRAGADGDQLAAVSRPVGLRALRLLPRLRVRVGAKASTLTTVIPEAEATGRCEVRSESYVSRIETSNAGRATGVTYFDRDRREHLQRARAVVVCANGAETPRLLLMSANGRFPHGLANSSGLVGKYLMFNFSGRVTGLFEHELNEYKSVQVTRILHDFYDSDPKRGFYGGGGLDARIGPQPSTWAMRVAIDGPAWGSAYKARLQEFPRTMQVAPHARRWRSSPTTSLDRSERRVGPAAFV